MRVTLWKQSTTLFGRSTKRSKGESLGGVEVWVIHAGASAVTPPAVPVAAGRVRAPHKVGHSVRLSAITDFPRAAIT
jgi:hypothetical protein